MKHFIALLLVFTLAVCGFGQTTERQTQKVKRKVASKTQNVKAKTTNKVKPKVKSKPELEIIEATTKDGKAVTLKSNGTWKYTKAEPDVKPTPKPSLTPKETPAVVAKSTPAPMPNPMVKPTPAVKPTPGVKTKPVPQPTQCDLTLKDAPLIRGLKLGMPRSDADKLIPLERVTILDSSDIIAYPKQNNAGAFTNVSQVSARFVEERLSGLEIEYNADAVKWKNAKDFAENLSANLNLPVRFWKFDQKNPVVSEMRCREFSVKINSSLNEIAMEKSIAPPGGEQVKETQKKAFKP